MVDYIALIRKDPRSDYSVDFPDFPGCVTAGATLDEARTQAAEALALHLAGMIEDGEAVPEPTALETIMTEAENRQAVAFLVPSPAQHDKATRVNITLPGRLLEQIDTFTRARHTSRSAFLAKAAKRAMQNPER